MFGWNSYRFVLGITLFLMGVTTVALAQPQKQRVVILGFDGADARIVESMLEQGKLPNLQELRKQGGFYPLLPTNPAQTPVSWSSMATGLNPGRTQIFDFLKREQGSYMPTFALMTEKEKPFFLGRKTPWALALAGLFLGAGIGYGVTRKAPKFVRSIIAILGGTLLAIICGWLGARWLPRQLPIPHNNRQGMTFWEMAAKHGLKVRVLRYPTGFPADKLEDGHMLSGLGVPDIRSTIGQPTIYTDDASLLARANEFSLKVELVDTLNLGEDIQTKVWGPRNKIYCDTRKNECREWMKARGYPLQISEPMRINLDLEQRRVSLSYRNQHATLREKEWSDWFVFEFPITPIVKIKAIGRFYLIGVDPYFMLYLSPLNFHSDMATRIPFAYPASWIKDMTRQVGFFKTMGWAIDTWTITSGLVEESHFLQDMNETVKKYREIMNLELADDSWDLFVMVYAFTDRIQHVLWRLMDTQHPLYDAQKAQVYGAEISRAYKLMDDIVGDVLHKVPKDTRIIVVSDHGFTSFRRGVNYTKWLMDHGFLKLKSQSASLKTLEDLFSGGDFFEQVDWSQTKAYSIGLGPIYLNVKGREPQGSVQPGEEYEAVRKAIIQDLENLVDPVTGEKPVFKVYTREEMYGSGFDPNLVPDLRVANTLNYRVDWQTTLGNPTSDEIMDNLKNWSADHCSVEPSLVKGILFTNWPLNVQRPVITDLMPTILELLHVPVPAGLDGHPLITQASAQNYALR